MSLPDKPNTVVKVLPSYLYFQYQDDDDLPALINAYNILSQTYLDDMTNMNLPVYTGLTGSLLDWVGQGLYGIPRPVIPYDNTPPIFGPTATTALASHQILWSAPTGGPVNYVVSDDIYKRIITWKFFKGDGFEWSVDWLKRRIVRFLTGANGTAPEIAYTPNVSVKFPYGYDVSHCGSGCGCCYSCGPNGEVPVIEIAVYGFDTYTTNLFARAIGSGALPLPFRFNAVVDIQTKPFLVLDNRYKGLDYALLWTQTNLPAPGSVCQTFLQLDNPKKGLDSAKLTWYMHPLQLDTPYGLDRQLFGGTNIHKPLLTLDVKCAGLDCALLGYSTNSIRPFLQLDNINRGMDYALLKYAI